jgi:hypothetical protein|tara:strand:+ start:599 stop:1132 length:534 start_codon:yes stop_codon:yes gene_type:complete
MKKGDVFIFDELFSERVNLTILQLLSEEKFQIATEGKYTRFQIAVSKDIPHPGFQLQTADKDSKIMPSDPLNFFAFLVIEQIVTKLKINDYKLERIFWNYYHTGMEGYGHKDRDQDNFISIVYNLHSTDGGTEIGGKFFEDKMGSAKVFHSNIFHKGVSTKKQKARFNLNIILKLCK